jgi:hypothetical protein
MASHSIGQSAIIVAAEEKKQGHYGPCTGIRKNLPVKSVILHQNILSNLMYSTLMVI